MAIDAVLAGMAERLFPSWGGPAERLRFLLQWAVLAPSRHNTQPWLFEIEGDELRLTCTVPANTTATIHVPAADAGAVTEGGRPAAGADGLRLQGMADGAAVFAAGSGTYRLVSKGFRK